MVYWLRKSPCFEFFGYGKYGLFWAKKLVEIWYLLITETFLLWTFRGVGNTVFLWDKNLMEIWYLRITEKFLFWNFREWEIRSCFEAKGSWKNGIYWFLKSSCFELFGDGKDGLFLRQKVNGKMIFPDYWKVLVLGYRKVLVLNFSLMGNIYLVFFSFPWSEKYGFSCSVFTDIITDNIFPTKDNTYS